MVFTGMMIIPLVRFLVKKGLIFFGLYTKNAAVVGKKSETSPIIFSLKKLESTGYKILAVLEVESDDFLNQLKMDVLRDRVESLFIVSKGIRPDVLNQLINKSEEYFQEIKIVSDSSYLKTMGVETEYVDELLMMRMANKLLSPANRFFKRMFDIIASLFGIIILMPIFVLISVVIKLGSRGPVLFIQERFGKGGKQFKFIKFRSMYMDSDNRLNAFLNEHPQVKEEWEKYKKLKQYDPRVTPFGKFLRRFSLDEAPQLFNVLKGDMSIVGPRPYLIREKAEIEKSAAIIFRVKSGLTGLWQIKGRSEVSFENRLKLDEFYVRNWSFFLDIIIILKSFGAVFRGKGAY
jgi:undecaprenyl-phosphate galactose phosphotransferase